MTVTLQKLIEMRPAAWREVRSMRIYRTAQGNVVMEMNTRFGTHNKTLVSKDAVGLKELRGIKRELLRDIAHYMVTA